MQAVTVKMMKDDIKEALKEAIQSAERLKEKIFQYYIQESPVENDITETALLMDPRNNFSIRTNSIKNTCPDAIEKDSLLLSEIIILLDQCLEDEMLFSTPTLNTPLEAEYNELIELLHKVHYRMDVLLRSHNRSSPTPDGPAVVAFLPEGSLNGEEAPERIGRDYNIVNEVISVLQSLDRIYEE